MGQTKSTIKQLFVEINSSEKDTDKSDTEKLASKEETDLEEETTEHHNPK